MYKIRTSKKFDKALQLCNKRGYDMKIIQKAMKILENDGVLPPEYKTHKLHGEYKDCLECHLTPDWLMIWQKLDDRLMMLMTNTGTHSDLFGK